MMVEALFATRKGFLGGDGSRSRLAERAAVKSGARPGENFSRFHQNQTGYADGIAKLFADLCLAAEGLLRQTRLRHGSDSDGGGTGGAGAAQPGDRLYDDTGGPATLRRAERRSKSFVSHR
jgi:hypothetical protein